ncbi:MAG: MFS transporter, partial [Proteobacteria bacterium]|nr:MFS transporter [Pseudomonadota bacterium]
MTDDPGGSELDRAGATDGNNQTRSLVAVIASISIVGMTFGITSPLLSLILERQGVSYTLISLNTAMAAAGSIAFAPLLPGLVRRFGTANVLLASIAMILVALVLLPLFPNFYAWFAIRFLYGMGGGALFILSETWINQIVPDEQRGRILGLYVTVMSVGIAVGPIILMVVGTEGLAPFLVGMSVVALGSIPVILARRSAPRIGARSTISLLRYVRIAPSGTLAGLTLGFIETSALFLLPLYALRRGLEGDLAVLPVTIFVAGAIVIPLFFGWLADRLDRRTVLAITAALASVSVTIYLVVAAGSIWFWIATFVWGGTATAIYSVGLTLLGQRFRGPDLVAASAVIVSMYSIGTLVGPIVTGAAMDAWDVDALPIVAAVTSFVYAIVVT